MKVAIVDEWRADMKVASVEQTFAYVAAGDEFAFFAKERRVVDGEEHTHGRLIDFDRRQRVGIFAITDSVANFEHDVFVQIKQHGIYFTCFERAPLYPLASFNTLFALFLWFKPPLILAIS